MNGYAVEKYRAPFLPVVVCAFLMALPAGAREWTSTDGKKLDADFISSTPDQVTLKRSGDGVTFTLPQSRLIAEDRKWISEQRSAVMGAPGEPAKPATQPAKPSAPAAPAKPIEGSFAALITGDWALSEQGGLKFALYGGKELSATEKYPLILVLHGRSKNEENGKQVGGWMKSFTKPDNYTARPCFIVAPMSAQPEAGEGRGYNGKETEEILKLVKALIKGLPVDPKRVYIAGHSMGGYGSCHIMGHEPRLFAAGIAVAGTSNADDAAALQRKPFWMFHATDDASTPVQQGRDFAKMMKASKAFKFTEPPTGGHGVIAKVFEDSETHVWLFEQRLK